MKAKRVLGITALVIVLLMILLGVLSGFITDYWWFQSLGYTSVFWTTYESKYLLWFAGFVVFMLAMNLNLSIALKSAQGEAADSRFELLIQVAGRFIRRAMYVLSILLSFVMAGMLSGSWMDWLVFRHAENFPITDPVFGNNVGFYVFTLPFIDAVRIWLLTAVVIILIAVLLVYLVRQGVSFAFGRLTVSDRARRHLGVLLGVLFVLIACTVWLGRYDVLTSSRSGSYYGAGYTDVYGTIPAAWIMTVVTLVAGAVLIRALIGSRVKLFIRTLVAYIVTGIVVGGIYPVLLQQFIVNPTEQSKELPYISNNIRMTRYAYDLGRIVEKTIDPGNNLTAGDLRADSATVRNIMLWDYRPLASTLDQLQVIRLYYAFPDVDIDRYRLSDGTYRQVMLSARELDQSKLPQNARTWVNQNLVYTHGYGIGMSPVNVVTDEGLPEFFVRDIPPVSPVGITIERPEVYFGERTDNHVIVNGNIDEFDYPLGDQNQMTRYKEQAGVPLGSLLRRLVFAMHFADINILISGYITPESRMLYMRSIHERLETIAPFLTWDQDPFVIAAEGRLRWLCDGYSTSLRFPYSKPNGHLNYIRNSVKAVIDAYNGDTKFYLFNAKSDPVIRVYSSIFPGLFRDQAELPAALREHVRYPQDLFDIQASVYETYHMEDPRVFYNKEDLWNIANEKLQDQVMQMESYYAIMRLPGEPKEEFIQMLPYTPNKRDNMIAWLCARSDGDNYGKMLVYKFPKKELTYGPMQVVARFDQDPYISQQLTLWNQQGSSVTRGNLLVIPIKQDVLYVQPVYLQATSGKIPELARVIVSYGNRIAMERTLDAALAVVFREGAATSDPGAAARTGATDAQPAAPALSVKQLSRQALERYDRAVKAQRDGDWSKYGEEIKLLRKDIEQIIDAQK